MKRVTIYETVSMMSSYLLSDEEYAELVDDYNYDLPEIEGDYSEQIEHDDAFPLGELIDYELNLTINHKIGWIEEIK